MSYHYLDSIFDSISMSYNYTLINGNTVIATTGDTSYQTTVSKLNQILLNNHQQVNKPDTVEFSVQAYLTTSTPYTDAESDKIMLIITPYQGLVTYAALYVPGDYQGWAPDVAPKIYSFENDGIYTGYIYFPAGGTYEFKFTSDPDWDHTNYGVGADTTLLNTDPTAGNLSVWGPGGYYFTVNTNDLTWTKTLENWGVIGEWLGWSTDIKLDWDITTEDLSVVVNGIPAADNQRFKFRANDAWDINLGAIDPPDGKTLTQGGADIPIPNGGNLKFILRFTTPEPTYEVIPQ
jgi:hypothetical protein